MDVLTLDYIERISGCFRLFTRVVTFDVTKTKKQSAQCQVLFNFFQKLKEESNKFHFTKKLTKPDFDIPFITPIVGLGNTFLPKTRFFFGLQTTACLQNSKRHFSSSHCKKPVDNSFYAELWTKQHWLNSVGEFLISNKKPTETRLGKKQEKTKKATWFLPSKKVSWAFNFFFHSFTFEISFFQNKTFFSSKFWSIPILRFLDSCRRRRKYRKKCFL